MRKSDQLIKPFYEQPDYINFETGEFIEESLTTYGGAVAEQPKRVIPLTLWSHFTMTTMDGGHAGFAGTKTCPTC